MIAPRARRPVAHHAAPRLAAPAPGAVARWAEAHVSRNLRYSPEAMLSGIPLPGNPLLGNVLSGDVLLEGLLLP
jgi:hypothetical protein